MVFPGLPRMPLNFFGAPKEFSGAKKVVTTRHDSSRQGPGRAPAKEQQSLKKNTGFYSCFASRGLSGGSSRLVTTRHDKGTRGASEKTWGPSEN